MLPDQKQDLVELLVGFVHKEEEETPKGLAVCVCEREREREMGLTSR